MGEEELSGLSEFWSNVIEIGTTSGGKILLAILTAVVGLIVIKILGKIIKKSLAKTNLADAAQVVIQKIAKVLLFVILAVAIIEILGVPMTSMAALIASGGLAVGLAFQGALSNLAGGFLILVFRPFKIGDYIDATGAEGFVRDINIFYTKLITLDNKQVLVPNGDLMSTNVTNLTAEPVRRIDQSFKITNDIDQDIVTSVLMEAARSTKGVLEDPEPFARLTAVDDDTYIFEVRAWCETPKYWDVYFDLIETCSKALAANGIDDPEERIAVRLVGKENDEE